MRWTFFAYPVVLLIDLCVFLGFIAWHEESVFEYEQRQLDLVANYAVDAATFEMLENTTDVGIDYIDWGSIDVDPKAGYNAFMAVIVRSRGWSDNVTNRNDIEADSIPFFLVAGYDGYYLYSKQKVEALYEIKNHNNQVTGTVDNTIYDMVWTPKIPYATDDVNTYGIIASDSVEQKLFYLDDENYGSIVVTPEALPNGDIIYNAEPNYNKSISVEFADPDEANRLRKNLISELLTEACNAGLFSGTFGKTDNYIYIPPEYQEWVNTSSVDRPTIITYITNGEASRRFENYSFAVGGAYIEEADFVICYEIPTTLNGVLVNQKFYTSVDNRAEVENIPGVNKDKFRIMNSAKLAAMEGYYFDTRFLE